MSDRCCRYDNYVRLQRRCDKFGFKGGAVGYPDPLTMYIIYLFTDRMRERSKSFTNTLVMHSTWANLTIDIHFLNVRVIHPSLKLNIMTSHLKTPRVQYFSSD